MTLCIIGLDKHNALHYILDQGSKFKIKTAVKTERECIMQTAVITKEIEKLTSRPKAVVVDLKKRLAEIENQVRGLELAGNGREEVSRVIHLGLEKIRPGADRIQAQVAELSKQSRSRFSASYAHLLERLGVASLDDLDAVKRGIDRVRRRVLALERSRTA